jgi:hypothetical protein
VIEPSNRAGSALGAERLRLSQRFVLALLVGYKRFVSPLLPRSCRFSPTCSEYAQLAVRGRGVTVGLVLVAWRLLRCQPFAAGGIDLP